MQALMMDAPLTLDMLARRFEEVFPTRPIVSRRNDRVVERSTWGEVAARARRWRRRSPASAFSPAIAWPRLPGIIAVTSRRISASPAAARSCTRSTSGCIRASWNTSSDTPATPSFWSMSVCCRLLDRVSPSIRDTRFVVMRETDAPMPARRSRLRGAARHADAANWTPPVLDERHPAAMCYTTGHHRAAERRRVLAPIDGAPLARHRRCPTASGFAERDVVLPVVPMFHVNAWGFPFAAALVGAEARAAGTAPRSRQPARSLSIASV